MTVAALHQRKQTSLYQAVREARQMGLDSTDEIVEYLFAHFADEIDEWIEPRRVIRGEVWRIMRAQRGAALSGQPYVLDEDQVPVLPSARAAADALWNAEWALNDGTRVFTHELTVEVVARLEREYGERAASNGRRCAWFAAVRGLLERHGVVSVLALVELGVELPPIVEAV